jgi:hypothetical protein
VRDNGHILDSTRCVLGGTDILAKLFDDPVLQSYKMHVQRWPRDVDLKKGLLSGLWKDLKTVCQRGTPPSQTTDERLVLQLQGLPATAALLNGFCLN